MAMIFGGSSAITGEIRDFAGPEANVPAGWQICDGSAISRTGVAAALFALIGTTYGAGDGSTTFNVPDLRGRVIAGKDNMGGSSANRLITNVAGGTLGSVGGAESHTLTLAQMASHTHTLATLNNGPGSTAPGNGLNSPGAAATTSSAGSNQAHNNTQPTLVANKIIKL